MSAAPRFSNCPECGPDFLLALREARACGLRGDGPVWWCAMCGRAWLAADDEDSQEEQNE